ncbi:hypothetical protein PGT21_021806 [Puccinia graminis f. sp. tritici]|uniref:Uncharacterized protein n=1 Tax=Puccinia graminis f. sp. tritici TaxID=56615 RepID=A0A5B0P8I9_PUCGR|nr:hypothetical protein PGT21_021806 [Puccinia graminis f. sp. tritici]KAA1131840.1 hypothetical protein PGTUg99_029950 [Puccinia graminis f. sp. tritici]
MKNQTYIRKWGSGFELYVRVVHLHGVQPKNQARSSNTFSPVWTLQYDEYDARDAK